MLIAVEDKAIEIIKTNYDMKSKSLNNPKNISYGTTNNTWNYRTNLQWGNC